jgi:probable HAF family extracellular repeat protein
MVNASVQLAYRLTPDYADADGDGNPWYADTDGDGFNDLMVELVGLGGDVTRADDINAAGQVVGYSSGRAVRWDFAADGTPTITVLPLLSRQVRGMNAAAINDAGHIVGGASTQNSSTSFLFQNGKMYDFATLLVNGTGWTGLSAGDINNQGIITGVGNLNGVRQGFVAIPVTQP